MLMNALQSSLLFIVAFDEQLIREYVEAHGFFVRSERRILSGRRRHSEEIVDLRILKPTGTGEPTNFLWFSSDLRAVREAVVYIRPWHREAGFNPRMLVSRPVELVKFIETKVVKSLTEIFNSSQSESAPRVLVLPAFPTADPQRAACTHMLRSAGVDAVLSFRSILDDVVQRVDLGQAYTRTEFMETLRILRSYDLLKDPQMGLFSGDNPGAKK